MNVCHATFAARHDPLDVPEGEPGEKDGRMNDVLVGLLLVVGCLVASILSAVTGFGGAAILLPILAAVFGVRDAIPILTVVQLVGNASRVWFNRKETVFPVIGWFALGSVPAGIVGGILFASAPLAVLHRFLGVFLLLVVVYRHMSKKKQDERKMPVWWFAPIGAIGNFISALVVSVGPLMAPFFLAYGLTKGAYIGTEALAAVSMHVTKLAAYGGTSVLTAKNVGIGLLLGIVLIFGTYLGKRIVEEVSEKVFVVLIEVTLVVAGVYFLVSG